MAREARRAPSDRAIETLPREPASLPPADHPDGHVVAKVIAMHGDHFRARVVDRSEVVAVAAGPPAAHEAAAEAEGPAERGTLFVVFLARKLLLQRREFQHPVAVGDDVVIAPIPTHGAGQGRQASLVGVFARRSALGRPMVRRGGRRRRQSVHEAEGVPMQVMVANVDHVLITVAARPGEPLRTNLIDRFLVAAERNGLAATVVVNKADLVPDGEARAAAVSVVEMYRQAGYASLLTSAETGEGIGADDPDGLGARLRGRTSVFAGPSGVGKSSLLNAVEPGLELRVGAVNRKTGEGRHTTTTVTLLQLEVATPGFVVDTPGIREFGIPPSTARDLTDAFPEIRAIAGGCAFRDCDHGPLAKGCVVLPAVGAGAVDPRRHASFRAMVAGLAGGSTRPG